MIYKPQILKFCSHLARKSLSHLADSSPIVKHFEVPTFCNLSIHLPCRVAVNHSDLHQYQPKLVIRLSDDSYADLKYVQNGNCISITSEKLNPNTICDIETSIKSSKFQRWFHTLLLQHKSINSYLLYVIRLSDDSYADLKYVQNGNSISITSEKLNPNTICDIETSIKSNLDITSAGDIAVGHFESDYVKLNSKAGNVTLGKYVGKDAIINTCNGNITFLNAIHAKSIKASVSESGSIKSGKVQGLDLCLSTKEGNITLDSSYCNNSEFKVNNGSMVLSNVHRDCTVRVEDHGTVKMTGVDGKLQVYMNSGTADIQLSRIEKNSGITIKENGKLILRLSDECQDGMSYCITSKDTQVDGNLQFARTIVKDTLFLSSLSDLSDEFIVSCEKGQVEVKSASWAEMLFADKLGK